jgi:2-oxoisovalerate dehydrogenase E2 component (dihydrolipoyl transacylase)
MAERVIKLPDVGEGVAEAELVEWHVKVGDLVREDAVLAAVMTDKATVEIPSPVDGEIVWLGAKIGDVVAVGSDLVRLNVPAAGARPIIADQGERPQTNTAAERANSAYIVNPDAGDETTPARTEPELIQSPPGQPLPTAPAWPRLHRAHRAEGRKPIAAPAVRLRALEAGIDLRQVAGSGPASRITHEDLDGLVAQGSRTAPTPVLQKKTAVTDIRLVGLRRKIAEKMALASTHIPHITYVEEVDVTEVERLRGTLNERKSDDQPRLTLLPFLMRAMVRAIADQPDLNALFDDSAGVVHRHAAIHIGIATQTRAGLLVPVVRHAEALDLWGCAAEVARLAEVARQGTAVRDELSGSTITITSLGALGGTVTTPIINHPEVAIIGVNKMMVRPVWDGSTFLPRKMINLSSSFDHRVIDGWDAATFVQRIRTLLETPALIFMED